VTPTPRMKTHIKMDRYGLFALVTITHHGRTARTTMDPDIESCDLRVENFKRAFAQLSPIKEDA